MGLGYGDHVASVVTFGTPHLGSVMVDMLNEGDPDDAGVGLTYTLTADVCG